MAVVLLEPADAVFETGGAGPDPGARQRLRDPARRAGSRRHLGAELHGEGLEPAPLSGSRHGSAALAMKVSDSSYHRRHVAGGEAHRLDRHVEGVRRRAGRENHQRRVRIAPVDGEIEVRLLGLGRHAGRRPGTLGVDKDERQLGGNREAKRLGLECHTRARNSRSRRARTGIGRADGGARCGDLVLGLEGHHVVGLEPGEHVQHG